MNNIKLWIYITTILIFLFFFTSDISARWQEDKDFNIQNISEVKDNTWTIKNTSYEIFHFGLSIIDWKQTLYATRNPDKYYEGNPFMPKHPSEKTVNHVFAVYSLIHFSISYFLPKKYRDGWQIITISKTAINVYGNYQAGIRIHF